jgi:hypothetical protein
MAYAIYYFVLIRGKMYVYLSYALRFLDFTVTFMRL